MEPRNLVWEEFVIIFLNIYEGISIGMNSTQSIGAMKMTSVVGDASVFITGKLTEMIDGDVHSETKMERNEVSEKSMNIQSNDSINKHAQKEVQNNSGEKSKAH